MTNSHRNTLLHLFKCAVSSVKRDARLEVSKGGRNKSFSTKIARHVQNRTEINGLVAGTDLDDSPANAAGAFLDVDTFTLESGVENALRSAYSAFFLDHINDQVITGPAGSNVWISPFFTNTTEGSNHDHP